jgi:hypothetical protein
MQQFIGIERVEQNGVVFEKFEKIEPKKIQPGAGLF